MTGRGSVVVDRGRGSPGGRGSPVADPGRGRGTAGSAPVVRGRGLQRGRGLASIFMHGRPADVDPRIADDSDKALVASFHPTAGAPGDLPLRPDFGAGGREIKLRTNFFPVQISPDQQGRDRKLYMYHVRITPFAGPAIRRIRKRVYDLAERTAEWAQAGMIGTVVHDGDTELISSSPLPQPLMIEVPFYAEDERGPPRQGNRVYTLEIMFTGEIDTGDFVSYLAGQAQHRAYNTSPVVAALNLILTFLPRKMDIVVGRNWYFSRAVAQPFRLGGGAEAWNGIYASVRPTYKQMMVNVDVHTTAFRTPGNMAFVMNDVQDPSLGPRARAFLRGVRIETTHLGRRKVVSRGLPTTHTARTYSFDTFEYVGITVEDLFRRKYNIRLQYPDLPLVNVGTQTANYFPAEVCNILPGQRFYGMLTDQQAVAMSAVGCRPPCARAEMTVAQLRHQLGLDLIRPELESFGVTISPDMAIIPGRILSSPGITYASGAAASTGERAFWNLIGVKFAVGARLDNWAVLIIKGGAPGNEFASALDGDLRGVVAAFRRMCDACGVRVTADPTYATAQLPPSEPFDPMRREAIQIVKNTLLNVKPKPTLVLIMLPNMDNAIYEGVKHLCDVRLDVATVCVQSGKIRRCNPHYLANIVSKVNMKLGGINHRLDGSGIEWLKGAPTMVVGIDVTHPNPGSAMGCPSIAAVVASVDNDFAQYPAALEIQESRGEMITNLKDMMISRLKLFQNRNDGKLPERILIYRSGISENQFHILREMEAPLITEAFMAFSSGTPYRPKFTIVACSKSRHVRFYPTEQRSATVFGNSLPGTVVDRGITAIYNFDFFLQSHGCVVQGTTRPTRYYVVHDEIGFKADEIQGVTNALCYMFGRATQAISLVSPAYYADAACQRGRCYLRKLFYGYISEEGTTNETRTESEDATEQDATREAQRLWGWGVAGAGLRESMFYL